MALRDIYRTTVRMRTYARNRQREIQNAEQAAIQQLMVVENAQNQVDRDIPRTNNNEIKIPEHWLPRMKVRDKNARVRTDFIRGRVPRRLNNDVRRWYGGWPIPHQGGHSRTGIWIGVNNRGDIIDRVVCKAVTESRQAFSDVTRWEHGANGMRDNRQTILPMEVVCNLDLDAIQGTRVGQAVDVVGLRDYNVDISRLTYTMYLDYCGRGDLDDLIKRYNGEATDLAPPPTELIPEPFLWRTFLALAVAGLAMQNGAIISNQKDPGWAREIVHRDLKPANVFLDEPTEGHFDTYPTVRLGDFGIAVKTHRNDFLNPDIFLHFFGTLPFAAPEQLAYADLEDGEPVDRFQQLSWSNVYSIGMTMLSLITLIRFPGVAYAWGDEIYGHDFRDESYAQKAAHYSNDLVNLVQECLDMRPLHRIKLPALLARIEQAIDVDGDDLATGRQHKFIEDLTQHDPDRLWCPQDAYARALTRAEMPAPGDF